ncbi:MAG: cupredoxin family copper-binding protein [Rhizomicrobium sp.]|jgi:plastocyanin
MLTKNFGRNLIGAFAVTAMLATASAAGTSAAMAQEANSVVMKNFDFAPMSITIKAGTSVTWKNLDGEPHTVTSVDGLFRSGALDQNDSFTFKFDKPGTYKYLCSIHPRMTASVIVQ